jgi:hypothetical protein
MQVVSTKNIDDFADSILKLPDAYKYKQDINEIFQNEEIYTNQEINLAENNFVENYNSKNSKELENKINSLNNKKQKKKFQLKKLNKKLENEIKKANTEKEDDDSIGSIGDDWLLKWSILNDQQKFKIHEEAFFKYDILKVGHISGSMLVNAINEVKKLNNNQINYLFNVLNLCEVIF